MMTAHYKLIIKMSSVASLLFLAGIVLFLPQNAHAMEPIYSVLQKTDSGEGAAVLNIWNILINFSNTFVIVVLIAVAFAQILRINVSTYGVKKILPTLVFAIIAANFSFLFCRLMIDVANAVMSVFFEGGVGVDNFQKSFQVSIGSVTDMSAGDIFWFILGQIFKMAAAVIVYILAFLFLIRNWMIYFLVALSPFCIMSMVLPQTKSLFTQWWSNLTKWVFMPIVSVFWLWLGAQWFNTSFADGIWLINYVFGGVCIYMALTTPFKMGGAIMNQWGGIGKKIFGTATKVPGWASTQAGQRLALRGQNLMKKYGYDKNSLSYKKGKLYENLGGAINVPGAYRAYQVGKKGKIEAMSKAELKTGTYKRYGGEAARVAGARAKNEEELANAPARVTVEKMQEIEDEAFKYLTDGSTRDRRQAKVLQSQIDGITKKHDWTKPLSDPEQKEIFDAMRRHFSSTGVGNMILQYGGSGGLFKDEEQAVLAEGWSKNFIKDYKSNVGKQEIRKMYRHGIPTGAVDNPFLFSSATGEAAEVAGSAIHTALPAQASQIIASVAGHENMADILEKNKAALATLAPDARKGVEDSLKQMCEERDKAVTDLMAGGEEEINRVAKGVEIIASAKMRGTKGLNSDELEKSLNDAITAIESKDKEKIKNLPSIISSATLGASPEKTWEALQTRVDDLKAGNGHLKSLQGYALMDAQAKLLQNPGQYVEGVKKSMAEQNALNARANVTGQMVGHAVTAQATTANPNATLGTVASDISHPDSDTLDRIAGSIEDMSKHIHNMSPGTINPEAINTKAMAMDAAKSALQGAFTNGATAQSPLSDRQTRRLFAEELGKATAKSLSKTLGQNPLKVHVVAPKTSAPTPTSTGQTPQTPTETPPASPTPPPEPPKSE